MVAAEFGSNKREEQAAALSRGTSGRRGRRQRAQMEVTDGYVDLRFNRGALKE